MTTHNPTACHDCADEEIARLRAELAEARETNRRLNRRVQAAEADVAAFRWFVEHDERAAAYLRHCPSFAPLAAASAMVAAWKAAEERAENSERERDAALANLDCGATESEPCRAAIPDGSCCAVHVVAGLMDQVTRVLNQRDAALARAEAAEKDWHRTVDLFAPALAMMARCDHDCEGPCEECIRGMLSTARERALAAHRGGTNG